MPPPADIPRLHVPLQHFAQAGLNTKSAASEGMLAGMLHAHSHQHGSPAAACHDAGACVAIKAVKSSHITSPAAEGRRPRGRLSPPSPRTSCVSVNQCVAVSVGVSLRTRAAAATSGEGQVAAPLPNARVFDSKQLVSFCHLAGLLDTDAVQSALSAETATVQSPKRGHLLLFGLFETALSLVRSARTGLLPLVQVKFVSNTLATPQLLQGVDLPSPSCAPPSPPSLPLFSLLSPLFSPAPLPGRAREGLQTLNHLLLRVFLPLSCCLRTDRASSQIS